MPNAHPLPLPVRVLNGVGHFAGRLGLPAVRLDRDSLLTAARKQTGLGDFGLPNFDEPLERLLTALENEADLTTLGRYIARTDLLSFLTNRLAIMDEIRRNPSIRDIEIKRPVFILGMPRTGTSILHELFSQDRTVRTPASWEVMHSCPPPTEETYQTDPRIRETDETLSRIDQLIPDFKKMHRMGARLPQECVTINAHQFTTMLFHTTYKIPSYAKWLHETADLDNAYQWHRLHLQVLASKYPASRWILKSPAHLWCMEDLLKAYPDARIIQTHRDPAKVLSSLVSLVTMLRSMASSNVDSHDIAAEWYAHIRTALDRSTASRESGHIPTEQVIDMHFGEFMSDTFDVLPRIYEYFDLHWTPEAKTAMKKFLDDHPADQHGRHSYRFEDTGLDINEVNEGFAHYRSFFGVESEPVA